jgi:hypothetical protein
MCSHPITDLKFVHIYQTMHLNTCKKLKSNNYKFKKGSFSGNSLKKNSINGNNAKQNSILVLIVIQIRNKCRFFLILETFRSLTFWVKIMINFCCTNFSIQLSGRNDLCIRNFMYNKVNYRSFFKSTESLNTN